MKLYDNNIDEWNRMLSEFACKRIDSEGTEPWPTAEKNEMILRSDMAYELGGSSNSLFALGATAITCDEKLVGSDEICLVGSDLCEIKKDISYARIAIVRVDADAVGDGNKLYDSVRKIDYVKYHLNLSGFMPRVSSVYGRESVRVSKEALKKGISFARIGSVMLNSYKKNPAVKAVKLVFVTDPSFDFKSLEKSIRQTNDITKTIDHIMKEAMTDCNSCSLQKVCDEVEGLRKLHFGMK